MYSLVIIETDGKRSVYSVNAPSSDVIITNTIFKGPNGGTAKITKDNKGNYVVNIMKPDGTTAIYSVTTTQGQTIPPPPQENMTSNQSGYTMGQKYTPLHAPEKETKQKYDYSSSLPKGVPKSMIPQGQEDLYILKSEVVPPVCPACPACSRGISSSSSNGGNPTTSSNSGSFLDSFSSNYMESTKCPPCPPCARCPEPAFDCKKVPNYNSLNNNYLPMPVLSDFSSFGM